jgi:hypothetical protein
MSSESSLWVRIRNSVGHVGDWQRIEFNPEAGVPDVNYCIKGAEGWLELKFRKDVPAREDTPVFKFKGLRPEQVAWINRRSRNHGRVFICAQVKNYLILIDGKEASNFNTYSFGELLRRSTWARKGGVQWEDWVSFLKCIAKR